MASQITSQGLPGQSRSAVEGGSPNFSYEELHKATSGFSKVLGIGEFHTVYLGEMRNLGTVAVKSIKLLHPNSEGGSESESPASLQELSKEQLVKELSILSRITHPNLIKLYGFCLAEDGILYLVLEFADGGSLKSRIQKSQSPPLTWVERLQILLDAAEGLNHLHNDLDQPIIHRDIKPDNILLTTQSGNIVAKIANFELAKETPKNRRDSFVFTTGFVIGTPGYVAPEYVLNLKGTKSIDVYAFGVMILELITGLPAFEQTRVDSSLVNHVVALSDSGRPLLDLADPGLNGDFDAKQFEALFQLAFKCCEPIQRRRPKIQEVLEAVKRLT